MRSKTKLALAAAGVIAAGGAIATSFEGRLVCDQDPRYATTASCVLDTLGQSGSAMFGWGEPLHLTLYGPAHESSAQAEPETMFFVTEYLVDENTGNVYAISDVFMPSEVLVFSSSYELTEAAG